MSHIAVNTNAKGYRFKAGLPFAEQILAVLSFELGWDSSSHVWPGGLEVLLSLDQKAVFEASFPDYQPHVDIPPAFTRGDYLGHLLPHLECITFGPLGAGITMFDVEFKYPQHICTFDGWQAWVWPENIAAGS